MSQQTFRHWIGIDTNRVSHMERWVAAVGAFLGILATAWISRHYLSSGDTWLMVGSMGASAVLLFAVPHGQLSQPWAATIGQLISAAIGVTCAKFIPSSVVAAASAVSLAVLTMHYLRCIHPPAGATALIAVIGGSSIHALGYWYIAEPVMINTTTIVLMAFIFNNLFRWRRYPASIQRHKRIMSEAIQVTLEDIQFALQQIDSPIDVIEEDILEIVQLANKRAEEREHRLANA